MKKTYRSKRDAPGALDHRDVILAADAKSSLFDAFYIQNLKQTKREMSVQCPMQFAASNKVRKRKYVRRVKEKPPLTNESMSQSTYLTPNKSIHVNRAPDLFDQLFNSSPTEIKKEVFNTIQIPDKRTYTRERRNKNKRINYSTSDSSDSDKENLCDANFTRNSSDIQKHKLIIENKNSPKKIDQSIKNILNSSIFKLETEYSPIEVKSPIISRIKKVQPAVLESSPLCSTPFNQKYRGKSIYNFSPIAINIGSSPECSIIAEDREDIVTDKDYFLKQNNKSLVKLKNDIENGDVNNTKSSNSNTYGKINKEELQSNQFGSIQITDEEPFLGFTNSLKTNLDTSKNQNVLSENSYTDNLTSEIFLEENKENNTKNEKEITSTNATSNSICNSDNESLYDTCSSECSEKLTEDYETLGPKEPIVVLGKLNNSIFEKYYRQMPDYSLESAEIINTSESLQSHDHSSLEDEKDESLEEIDENQDLNDTDKVNKSSVSEGSYSNINLEETCISFVTTRRRNKVMNGFSILALDNSYTTNENIMNNNSVNDSQLKDDEICDSTIIRENKESNNDIFEGDKTVKDKSINKDIKNNNSFNKTDSFKLSNDTSVVDTFNSITTRKSSRITKINETDKELPIINILPNKNSFTSSFEDEEDLTHSIVLQPGKKWERSLSIYRRMTTMADHFDQSILDSEDLKSKGRKYRQSVICTMEMQDKGSYNDSISSRRSTFSSKPSRTSIKLNNEQDASRVSICFVDEELKGFLNEDCDDTVIELSKLSIADRNPEVTIIENVHDTSHRGVAARDYVLRRCGQTDAILFDECYPDTVLKNCRKIGEGVYGEVFLWRARDGHARVLKVIPVGGTIKVNGENQKGFGEIISEIVIAMELSALRAPILKIKQHIDEGKDIETLDLHSVANATDVFNEVLAVRCVHGSYPSRLLDLWDLYDECKGSENDNPAVLPVDQQFIVLELANAGQDLESYQFNNAEQAYSIFKQVAFGLAVAEEAYQFEHRDLHWGNILIAPTEEKWAVFVLRGRAVRVLRRGVAGTVIDYSLSRLARRPGARALHLDLSQERELFAGRGDYQFDLYRLMRRALGNNWANYEPYTNVLWLHYTIDKMITSLRYSRPNTKIHKQYIAKLAILKEQLLNYRSATELVLTNNDL